jgi:hypothetical protein
MHHLSAHGGSPHLNRPAGTDTDIDAFPPSATVIPLSEGGSRMPVESFSGIIPKRGLVVVAIFHDVLKNPSGMYTMDASQKFQCLCDTLEDDIQIPTLIALVPDRALPGEHFRKAVMRFGGIKPVYIPGRELAELLQVDDPENPEGLINGLILIQDGNVLSNNSDRAKPFRPHDFTTLHRELIRLAQERVATA